MHLDWRAILKLRDLAISFIKFEVGDGKTIFLWHDNWHPIGTLSLEFGYRVMLGFKTLNLNVLELQFVMLKNHDQNVLVFFLDLLKVYLYVKLELSVL